MNSGVSNLILAGATIELVNGDTSSINDAMITDLLNHMKATLNTFKSFNTISILGIQSTGKSSLLNSMYNLDFAVSGGRTTKGINMRLLKSLDGEKAYVLMDTEGQG